MARRCDCASVMVNFQVTAAAAVLECSVETAAKILITGGMIALLYGLVTGIPASLIRQKEPDWPKYLRFAHVGALMWAPILLGLALAVYLSDLPKGLENVAAALMVAGAASLLAKDTINWLTGVTDEFAQRPPLPLALGAISAVASFLGASILTFGVFRGW